RAGGERRRRGPSALTAVAASSQRPRPHGPEDPLTPWSVRVRGRAAAVLPPTGCDLSAAAPYRSARRPAPKKTGSGVPHVRAGDRREALGTGGGARPAGRRRPRAARPRRPGPDRLSHPTRRGPRAVPVADTRRFASAHESFRSLPRTGPGATRAGEDRS